MSVTAWERSATTFGKASNGVVLQPMRQSPERLDVWLKIPGSGAQVRVRIEHGVRGGSLAISWIVWANCGVDEAGGPKDLPETIKTAQAAWGEFLGWAYARPGNTLEPRWRSRAEWTAGVEGAA